MIDAGVKILGKYVWGRYDILVLPASFPYGGMENPCLTFATPTIVVSLIFFEIKSFFHKDQSTRIPFVFTRK